MSEQMSGEASGQISGHVAEPAPETGVAEIDAALRDIAALGADPAEGSGEEDLAAHVQVFERAHAVLRRGLDTAADAG